MLKRFAAVALVAMSVTSAYAAPAPMEEERGFPLALVFALVAVFISVGVVIMAASQNKKKD